MSRVEYRDSDRDVRFSANDFVTLPAPSSLVMFSTSEIVEIDDII